MLGSFLGYVLHLVFSFLWSVTVSPSLFMMILIILRSTSQVFILGLFDAFLIIACASVVMMSLVEVQ